MCIYSVVPIGFVSLANRKEGHKELLVCFSARSGENLHINSPISAPTCSLLFSSRGKSRAAKINSSLYSIITNYWFPPSPPHHVSPCYLTCRTPATSPWRALHASPTPPAGFRPMTSIARPSGNPSLGGGSSAGVVAMKEICVERAAR